MIRITKHHYRIATLLIGLGIIAVLWHNGRCQIRETYVIMPSDSGANEPGASLERKESISSYNGISDKSYACNRGFRSIKRYV